MQGQIGCECKAKRELVFGTPSGGLGKGMGGGCGWIAAVASVPHVCAHNMTRLAGSYLRPPVVVIESGVHLSQFPKELVLVSVQLGNNSDRDPK